MSAADVKTLPMRGDNPLDIDIVCRYHEKIRTLLLPQARLAANARDFTLCSYYSSLSSLRQGH